MTKPFFVLMLLLCSVSLFAQKRVKKAPFYMVPQLGLVNGDHYVSGQLTLIGGFEKKDWAFGLGAGFDYYKLRTVPVFMDVRKNITASDWPVFAYANLGVNIPAPLETQRRFTGIWNATESSYQAGLYSDVGIGYAMLNKRKKGFILSLGFSTKGNTENYMETIYDQFPPYKANQFERKLSYSFNRVVCKIGFRL